MTTSNSGKLSNNRYANNSREANNSRRPVTAGMPEQRMPGKLTAERTTATEGPTAAKETTGTSGDANSRDARVGENIVKKKGC